MEHLFQEWVIQYGYIGIFALMMASSACIPVPSEIVLLVAGWYSATGRLGIVAVVLVALAGNLVGSVLAYYLGLTAGREALARYGRYVGIRAREIDKAERWWDEHGESATFFSRMVPILRTYISVAAGFARMPVGRFLAYTVAGMIPWTLGLAAAGYLVKDRWSQIAGYFSLPTIVIFVLLVAGAVAYFLSRKRTKTGPV